MAKTIRYSRQFCVTDVFFSCYQVGAPLTEGVEVALDPSELELDPAAMQARLVLRFVSSSVEVQVSRLSDMF